MINLKENIKSTIDNTPLAVVKFESDTCAVCKNITPVLLELENVARYEGVDFYTVNLDTNYEDAIPYGIRALPTVLFCRYGEVIEKQIGMANRDALVLKLEELITTQEY